MAVKDEDIKTAMEESENAFEHELKKPFEYNGETYTVLHFDFERLTGKDALRIEEELRANGKVAVVPALNGDYLIRMAALACVEDIGSDAFEDMAIVDYNRITAKARGFLLASE